MSEGTRAGRTIVITGATRGIGRALALRLAGPRVRLVLAGRSTEARPDKRLPGTLEQTARRAREAGADVDIRAVNLADSDEAASFAAWLAEQPVDVLVNNAAISYVGQFVDVAAHRWSRAFAVNLLAPVSLTQSVLSGMLERGDGLVLNVGSGAAHVDPVPQLPYSTSKLALERLTTGLAAQIPDRGVVIALVRIDELVVTEAARHSAPQLITDDALSADDFATAMQWVIDHPQGLHGRVLTLAQLRELGALAR